VVSGLECHVRAERGPADHRFGDVEMVHQADHLASEYLHRVVARVIGLVTLSVSEQIDEHDSVASLRERVGEEVVMLAGEEQAVKEHDRSLHCAGLPTALFVRQLEPVVSKRRHAPEPTF